LLLINEEVRLKLHKELSKDMRSIMHFILPKNTLVNLDFLREQYQGKKQINLSEDPSRFGRPVFFGGTDIISRRKQIQFLEKIQCVLGANLLSEERIATHEQWEANLTASRAMIAACLYITSQISRPKKNSALYCLLQQDLGITSENFLDEEDKEICFLAAKRLITSSISALDEANAHLKKAGKPPITEKEWDDFKSFLCKINVNKITANPYQNYPITSITQPLFGAAFAYAGASIGLLGGDMLSKSTKALTTKHKLTAAVGGTLLIIGSAGPAGVALFAPVFAEHLINYFCSITLAHVVGISMGLLGQGVGIGIGVPLDLAYRFLWHSCVVIGGYNSTSKPILITGTRIADGVTVIHGIVIEATEINHLPEGQTQTLEIKEGALYVNNKLLEAPKKGLTLPPEVLAELNAKLKPAIEDKGDNDFVDQSWDEETETQTVVSP
jgi:hypothetical protein